MKNKIVIPIVLCLLVILIVIYFNIESKGRNSPDQVTLETTVEHSDYIIHQNVWITVRIINNSSMNYYLKQPFDFGTFNVDIVGPDNVKWVNGMVADYEAGRDSIKLAPGDSKEISFSSMTFAPSGGKYTTGTHTITAYYQGKKSNQATFNLKEPSKDEQVIYNALLSVTNPQVVEQNFPIENIKKTEEFIQKYPDSKYTPQAYSWLFNMYKMLFINSVKNEDIVKYERMLNQYLEKYSNELETNYAIGAYAQALSAGVKLSPEEVKSKLQNISGRFSGSKTASIINKFIEEKIQK